MQLVGQITSMLEDEAFMANAEVAAAERTRALGEANSFPKSGHVRNRKQRSATKANKRVTTAADSSPLQFGSLKTDAGMVAASVVMVSVCCFACLLFYQCYAQS